ncbi:hypothetical protein GCM10010954_35080 [Halobacillus andaensis]|uniref:Uncharacterized protein n=1 Tax=Halobacillus andaensis TaxID=1176239 RepID=A0A917EYQ2_HALAA|nr:hypothetical protein GCM10010954_35080 [Halobacillus andaensis]
MSPGEKENKIEEGLFNLRQRPIKCSVPIWDGRNFHASYKNTSDRRDRRGSNKSGFTKWGAPIYKYRKSN